MRTLGLIANILLVACATASASRTLRQYITYTQQPVQQYVQANAMASSSGSSNTVTYAQATTQAQYSTATQDEPLNQAFKQPDDYKNIDLLGNDKSQSQQQQGSSNYLDSPGNDKSRGQRQSSINFDLPDKYESQGQQEQGSDQGSSTQSDQPDYGKDYSGRSSSRGEGDNIDDAVLQQVLDMHNSLRARHQVEELSWSSQLQSSAQDWANRCVFQHSGSGENLAMGFPSFESAVDAWFAEEKDYRWDGQYSSSSGHFTQAVWKDTTHLGCGYAPSCSMYVCHYDPAGNVIGYFNQNVFPATS